MPAAQRVKVVDGLAVTVGHDHGHRFRVQWEHVSVEHPASPPGCRGGGPVWSSPPRVYSRTRPDSPNAWSPPWCGWESSLPALAPTTRGWQYGGGGHGRLSSSWRTRSSARSRRCSLAEVGWRKYSIQAAHWWWA